MFQSTHPRGVRRNPPRTRLSRSSFQSTHPRGVRRRSSTAISSQRRFNPRTHVGCDLVNTGFITNLPVSIHAPTWGATDCVDLTVMSRAVSIHAPTWGATLQAYQLVRLRLVSIHAPTWGATSAITCPKLSSLFQSTHPRGVRHRVWNKTVYVDCFNPRTHVGCDRMSGNDGVDKIGFQSTHPRGVRLQQAQIRVHRADVSIHAPTWGATGQKPP